jgi:hypothetical protein
MHTGGADGGIHCCRAGGLALRFLGNFSRMGQGGLGKLYHELMRPSGIADRAGPRSQRKTVGRVDGLDLVLFGMIG